MTCITYFYETHVLFKPSSFKFLPGLFIKAEMSLFSVCLNSF